LTQTFEDAAVYRVELWNIGHGWLNGFLFFTIRPPLDSPYAFPPAGSVNVNVKVFAQLFIRVSKRHARPHALGHLRKIPRDGLGDRLWTGHSGQSCPLHQGFTPVADVADVLLEGGGESGFRGEISS
jgi:hypothetical protein